MTDVVLLGSSQSVPGTWVEAFASSTGYTIHNYSVSGGGFTAAGSGNFSAQLNVAIADKCYDHNAVPLVIVFDMGNDIRATYQVTAGATDVFSRARFEYPSARIVLVPCMWGDTPMNPDGSGNNHPGRIASISQRVQEARNAGLPYDVQTVPYTWTWMADAKGTGWMRPTEVHYTAEGYQRVADFMELYFKGGDTCYNVGSYLVPSYPPVVPTTAWWLASRTGDLSTIEGPFTLSAPAGLDTNLGQLSYGTWPIDLEYVDVVAGGLDRKVYTIAIWPNGLIRSLGVMPAGDFRIDHTYRSF